jgi:branched-chain amino acid transport system ATP-binding protein
MLDEPSLGLSPLALRRIYSVLPELVGSGLAVLLVEQDVRQALKVTDWLKCLLEGRQTLEGAPGELDVERIEAAYFGIGHSAQRSTAP